MELQRKMKREDWGKIVSRHKSRLEER